jgi:hypothetical protein
MEGYMESWSVPAWLEYPENGTRHTRNSCRCIQWLVGPPGPRGCGSPSAGLCRWVVSDDKNRPKLNRGKGTPFYCLSPRDIQKGRVFKPQRHQRKRPQREPNKGMWTHQRMSGVGCKQGDWEDEFWPVTSSGWSWGELEWGSHQD